MGSHQKDLQAPAVSIDTPFGPIITGKPLTIEIRVSTKKVVREVALSDSGRNYVPAESDQPKSFIYSQSGNFKDYTGKYIVLSKEGVGLLLDDDGKIIGRGKKKMELSIPVSGIVKIY